MPIIINNDLPVKKQLEKDNIFYMGDSRAISQDIRPLEILFLNLMPDKQATELDFYRQLSNTPLQLNITLMQMGTHKSKNTDRSYLDKYYVNFSDIKDKKFDGMIITGAPVEEIDFEDVDYWEELCEIMDWTNTNVISTLHICWGAFAAIYHYFGVNKFIMSTKRFGVFKHKVVSHKDPLMRGFDTYYLCPQSRWCSLNTVPEGTIVLSWAEYPTNIDYREPAILKTPDNKHVFSLGHFEYEKYRLRDEYERDLEKGSNTYPYNYFKETIHGLDVDLTWRMASQLFYSNWLNYYVYQESPYLL